MTSYKVGYLVGSLAKASINRWLASALVRLAPPSGIIGTSPGKIGTAIAQQHLRSILAFCTSPLMNSIEAYVQCERGLITDDGRVTDETTEQFLRPYMEEFAAFIARVYTVLPRNQ